MHRPTCSTARRFCAISLVIAAAPAFGAQPAPQEEVPTLRAMRIEAPVIVDGHLSEEAWARASAGTGFRQRDPQEGAPASERTEVRVLYDAEAIYVGIRMFDGEAAKITRRLSRRDESADADRVIVYLDPRHDHLTGASFELTAAGVQSDDTLYDDTRSDGAWDAVWAGRVTMDADGWSAEMRIPYSQLRFSRAVSHTWGFNVQRVIRRKNEYAWLVMTPKKERGLVSRMAHLTGLDGISPGAHVELLPYTVARGEFIQPSSPTDPFNDGSRAFATAGLDLKWGLSSSVTLDATVNPDFGQVELDPAVINLTAFETFFDEKRPFFIEGGQIFQNFGQLGGGWSEAPDLLYSRRIGRAPQGSVSGDYVDRATSTTILGAAKLTGKTAGGWSFGVLNAVTGREQARVWNEGVQSDAAIEPPTNYVVGRLLREASRGGVGVMGTSVVRGLGNSTLGSRLARQALVVGSDAYYFFDAEREWLLSGQLSASRVQGSSGAIERLQRSSSRYFQRPDALTSRFDSARTSLGGWSGSAGFGRQNGAVRLDGSLVAVSPGYEVNDLGYQTTADRIGAEVSVAWEQFEPDRFSRSRQLSVRREWAWNFDRQNQGTQWEVETDVTFLNYWDADFSLRREGRAFDDRLTRGGPAGIQPANWDVSFGVGSDSRKVVAFELGAGHEWNEAGGWETAFDVSLDLKVSQRLTISTGPEITRSRNVAQYVTSQLDPLAVATYGRRYIFGELDQTEVAMQTRLNLLLTPTVSLQVYAQPLAGAGRYTSLKEFARPGAFAFLRYGVDGGTMSYDAGGREYQIDPDGAGPARGFSIEDPDFNEKSFRLQTVFRWEWRPGSTFYVVWTQQREDEAGTGRFELWRDTKRLFGTKADNVFAVKISYWLGR
jgi:hypothetical protein